MALDKNGMDLKAIRKDQKAIDKLPNKGRAFGKKHEMAKKMHGTYSMSPEVQKISDEIKRKKAAGEKLK